jgi:hypothetical protein
MVRVSDIAGAPLAGRPRSHVVNGMHGNACEDFRQARHILSKLAQAVCPNLTVVLDSERDSTASVHPRTSQHMQSGVSVVYSIHRPDITLKALPRRSTSTSARTRRAAWQRMLTPLPPVRTATSRLDAGTLNSRMLAGCNSTRCCRSLRQSAREVTAEIHQCSPGVLALAGRSS